jgi:hypothetical protein
MPTYSANPAPRESHPELGLPEPSSSAKRIFMKLLASVARIDFRHELAVGRQHGGFKTYESRGFQYAYRARRNRGHRARAIDQITTPREYKPLATGEIRLIELMTGADWEPIECRLYHIHFHEHLKFEALSYTWGDAEPGHNILIDGKQFSVNPNLEDALDVLRREDEFPKE